MPSPTTKLPVRLPPSWLAAIEQAAAAESVSPSEWIRAAIRRSLPADLRKTLESVRGRGRPKKPSDNMKDCRDKGRLTALDPAWQDKRSALNSGHVEAVKRLLTNGVGLREIARRFRVNHKTVKNLMKRYRIANPRARKVTDIP